MLHEFGAGIRTMLRGFALWGTRPSLMGLGLVPAVIAALLVPLIVTMPSISAWLTPFAEGWTVPWQELLHGAVGIVVTAAAIALAAAVFSALTLTSGSGGPLRPTSAPIRPPTAAAFGPRWRKSSASSSWAC